MKHFILPITLAVLTFIVITPRAHALFGHTAEERQRRIAAEQQISEKEQRLDAQQKLTTEQQQRASCWQTTASVLGIAAAFALIAGTAIGSRGRHHAATGR